MDDEPEEMGIPEWVVTFGDMMSLLLTFFIMLVSLSEIKEEETYQALVDSMQRQFGYQKTLDALTPGEAKPRTMQFSVLSTQGRAKKKDIAKGGVPEKAPIGEEQMVRIVRPGQKTAVGSVVFFDIGSDAVDADAMAVLKSLAGRLRGKPQRIELRGHVSAQYAARTAGTDQAMLLAVKRAGAVRRFLVKEEGLSTDRFRISSADASEPMDRDRKAGKLGQDSRVEVFLLDETLVDPRGTSDTDTSVGDSRR
ncbi:MAG: flagellar motor protein MotB [Planctomycetota bacterium]